MLLKSGEDNFLPTIINWYNNSTENIVYFFKSFLLKIYIMLLVEVICKKKFAAKIRLVEWFSQSLIRLLFLCSEISGKTYWNKLLFHIILEIKSDWIQLA